MSSLARLQKGESCSVTPTSSAGRNIFFSLTPTTGIFCCPFVLAGALFILFFNPGDVRDYVFFLIGAWRSRGLGYNPIWTCIEFYQPCLILFSYVLPTSPNVYSGRNPDYLYLWPGPKQLSTENPPGRPTGSLVTVPVDNLLLCDEISSHFLSCRAPTS